MDTQNDFKDYSDIEIKKFRILEFFPELLHGFSTRRGGFSKAPFKGLNLGMHTGDGQSTVTKNRNLFYETLGVEPNQLVFPEQVHSDNIYVARRSGIVPKCDALITNHKRLFLTVQTADCFPVFIFDPDEGVVGLVHSGWRGTKMNICGKTIDKMVADFGCKAENLFVAIGPGVRQDCYQVDEKTAESFDKQYLIADGPGHYKLDLQGVLRAQILERGVLDENLEYDETCTHCAEDMYYSYRRDKEASGRMMGIIGITF